MTVAERLDFATCAAAIGALGAASVLAFVVDVQRQLWVPAGVQLLSAFIALRLWQARTPPVSRSLRLLVTLQLFSSALAASGLHTGHPDRAVAVPALAAGVPLLLSFFLRTPLASAAIAAAVHSLAFVAAMLLGLNSSVTSVSGVAALPVVLTALLPFVAVLLLSMGRDGTAPRLLQSACIVLNSTALISQIPIAGIPATSLLDSCPSLLLCASALARPPIPVTAKKTD